MEYGEVETWFGVNLVESKLWSSWLDVIELGELEGPWDLIAWTLAGSGGKLCMSGGGDLGGDLRSKGSARGSGLMGT